MASSPNALLPRRGRIGPSLLAVSVLWLLSPLLTVLPTPQSALAADARAAAEPVWTAQSGPPVHEPAPNNPVGYLPHGDTPGPILPPLPAMVVATPGGRAFLEARRELLSASGEDLSQGYAAQLDKVVILGYRAARQAPDDPAVWRLLGRLAETKALFSYDPYERSRLMGEADAHFRRSAALEERVRSAADAAVDPAPKTPVVSDPYLAELFWRGRLARGEATLADLERHWAGAGNLSPLQRPEFWRDRYHLVINANGPEARSAALAQARTEFEALWADMPVEVPWPGPVDKFGPPKLKKIEVLESWAGALAALARNWPPDPPAASAPPPAPFPDPSLSPAPPLGAGPSPGAADSATSPAAPVPPAPGGAAPASGDTPASLFAEALELYLRALDLPLDRHEAAALIGQMDRADDLAPDEDSLLALWKAKDRVYEKWIETAPDDPSVWLAWGEEHLRRAARQEDVRVYRGYFEEAGRKFERYAALSPRPALAFHEWGLREELRADQLAADRPDPLPPPIEPEAILGRTDDFGASWAVASTPPASSPAASGPAAPPPGAPVAAASGPAPGPPAASPAQAPPSHASAAGAAPSGPAGSSPGAAAAPGGSVQAVIDAQAAKDRLELAAEVSARALGRYRQAHELEPDRPAHVQSLARMILKAAARGPAADFPAHLEESDRYSALAVSQDPDTAGAWRARGVDCLVAASPSTVDPSIRERLVPEALSAFRRYLTSDHVQVDHLREIADLVWRAAEASPAHRVAALRLLDDVCVRLIALEPDQADYHFARGLTIYSILAADPRWPWDRRLTASPRALRAFNRAIDSYREGLEILARSGFNGISRYGRDDDDSESLPPEGAGRSVDWSFPRPILYWTVSPGATLASASFQERLAAVLNRELERLVAAINIRDLPPWHKFRLSGFFRRVAATGYPPPEDQMAFFRLAELLLTEAETEVQSGSDPGGPNPARELYALILAEKGLLMAEMSLVAVGDVDFLLSEAEKLWTGAEAASPGSSRYALARWAAWSGDVEIIRPLLRHTAEQQDRLQWPTYAQSANEPSLARYHGESWFINAWFGYGR